MGFERHWQEPLADNALTTIEKIRGLFQAGDITDDQIAWAVNAASDRIESLTGRKFKLQTYTEKRKPSGGQELLLEQWPIIRVFSVTDSFSGVVPPDLYDFSETGHIGVLYKDGGWTHRGYPHGLSQDPIAASKCLVVKYEAGYVLPKDATRKRPRTLPWDLEQLAWELAITQLQLLGNGALGLSAFSISDVSWTFDKSLSESQSSIINRYLRVA
jgi:hypothetical protein